MLVLKTFIRRTALPFVLFLVWTPAARAWSWPLQGPVLTPFSYDEAHPYAGGQHRGIDIGADAAGETVVAPATGTVSFAGTVPTNGKSVTIETADGYSVTLTHLGSFLVARGATVSERDPVGTIGPSGTPELGAPYVHLGIRKTADPNGYVDPLGLLPPATDTGGDQGGGAQTGGAQSGGAQGSGSQTAPTSSQPSSSAAVSTATSAAEPTESVRTRPTKTTRDSSATPGRAGRSAHAHQHGQESRPAAEAPRAARPHVSPAATPRQRPSRTASSSLRPVVETAASLEPAGLDAGHEPGPSAEIVTERPRSQPSGALLQLVLNGTAALVALGAALAAGRRRRRRPAMSPLATVQVLRLPGPAARQRRAA